MKIAFERSEDGKVWALEPAERVLKLMDANYPNSARQLMDMVNMGSELTTPGAVYRVVFLCPICDRPLGANHACLPTPKKEEPPRDQASKLREMVKGAKADVVDAYCVKCRVKRVLTEIQPVTMKNGRKAAKGKCGECGTGLYRILPKKAE